MAQTKKSVAEIWDLLTREEKIYARVALSNNRIKGRGTVTENLVPIYLVPFQSLQELNDSIADGWPGAWITLKEKCNEALR